jgi:dynein heavy chain
MDYSGWYDIVGNEKEFRKIVNIRFVAAIGPPGGGRNHITDRLVRHFNTIYVEPYSNYSQSLIFSSVVEALFLSNSNPSFSKTVVSLKESIVAGTIHMYNKVSEIFLPTPSKSHYTYNLRDVSKVFQGIYASKPKGI